MSKFVRVLDGIRKDEEGAALIEYTMLLGIIVAAVVVTVGLVGTWVNSQWTTLCKNLGAGC
jgi:pilus assembly protein Flp/PilA